MKIRYIVAAWLLAWLLFFLASIVGAGFLCSLFMVHGIIIIGFACFASIHTFMDCDLKGKKVLW